MSTERGAKNLVSPGGSTRRSAPVTEMHYDLREEINGMVNTCNINIVYKYRRLGQRSICQAKNT